MLLDLSKKKIKGLKKYMKRPVTVLAVQIDEPFEVQTLEGKMRGGAGDWLVVGIMGERYIVQDTIFRKLHTEIAK